MFTLSTYKRSSRTRSRAVLGAATAALLCTLAACGGSDSGGNSTGSDATVAPETVSQAEERVQPYLEEPTTIPVTTPLTAKPEAGKKLFLIRYNIPIAARLDGPTEEAAKALGWTLKVVAVDPTDPLAQSNAIKQAISAGADYIEVSSGSAASMGDGLQAAKDAGIPVFLQAGDTPAEGETNGIYGNSNIDYTNVLLARLLDLAIVDSKGTANVLMLSAPDYPSVAAANKYLENEFPKNCPSCQLQFENVSATDLTAGKTPDLAVSALRKNPDVDYVLAAFDSLADGVPQALKAAGLDQQVKILVLAGNKTMPPGLQDGSYFALAMQSEDALTWNAVDMAARLSVGMEVDAAEHAVEPGWIWTKDNAPQGETGFAGPTDYQEQYKKLWQVAS